jgi:hypothetical protein
MIANAVKRMIANDQRDGVPVYRFAPRSIELIRMNGIVCMR